MVVLASVYVSLPIVLVAHFDFRAIAFYVSSIDVNLVAMLHSN